MIIDSACISIMATHDLFKNGVSFPNILYSKVKAIAYPIHSMVINMISYF